MVTRDDALRGVALGRHEARRVCYALHRAAARPIVMRWVASGGEVWLESRDPLPLHEYRYVMALGERVGASFPLRFKVPERAWAELEATLKERLGVEMEQMEEVE